MARTPPPELPGVTHRQIEAGDVRLHVAESGSGDPLVLLHGWPQHWWTWRKVLPRLAADHRVLMPDLRGLGWSDAPPGDYRKEGFATDLLALLDALELDSVRLVGHDWGGFAGFLACLRAPERFERFVACNIIHPWYRPPAPTPKSIARISYQLILATPIAGEQVQRQSSAFIKTVLAKGAHPDFRWADGDRDVFADTFREPGNARASSAVYRTLLRREAGELRSGRYDDQRLAVPTLLLTGDADPVITPEVVAGAASHADDLRTKVLERCGHFPQEEIPDELASRILEFLGG